MRSGLKALGNEGKNWDIFRGDSFQAEIKNPKDVFWKAVYLKAALRSHKGLDARMAIGIGEKEDMTNMVSEDTGSAFIRSGEAFEQLKNAKTNLLINTENTVINSELNSCFKLALLVMDSWTANSAEIVKMSIENPKWNQTKIGKKIGIKQNTVSERLKRSAFEELREFDTAFRRRIKHLV
jgi:hypothetical protein